jgi:rod shape-determining protein MreD
MIKRILLFLALYAAIGLQISIGTPIPGLGWDADLVLLCLLLITSKTSPTEGIIWAAVIGLTLDAFDPSSMGGNIAAKTTAIFVFFKLNEAMNLDQPILLGAALLILSFLDRIIFRIFSPLAVNYGWTLIRFDIPSAIITALIGFGLLLLARRIGIFNTDSVAER